jgi:uncharacterized protein YndB with AHSA1/START domain
MTGHDTPSIRSLELEVEVPGTPEQVWQAIATGAGITAWFTPAEVAEHEGGTIAFDHGGGMEDAGVVTGWQPPRRFAYEEPWQPREDSPPARLATEWLVEARSGGTCVVRLVSNLFAARADWDDELGGMGDGWQSYLHNLRLYLTHFAGRPCAPVAVSGSAPEPLDEAWDALTGALGLPDAAVGERTATSAPGAPRLAGVVERRGGGRYHRELLLRVDEPAPGAAFVMAYLSRDRVYPSFRAYLFGDAAPAVAEREEAAWRAWMDERFADAPAAARRRE